MAVTTAAQGCCSSEDGTQEALSECCLLSPPAWTPLHPGDEACLLASLLIPSPSGSPSKSCLHNECTSQPSTAVATQLS
jgi:hypothetical protein